MKKVIISLIMMFGIISSTSLAGTLVINTDTSDAAPKEAFESVSYTHLTLPTILLV